MKMRTLLTLVFPVLVLTTGCFGGGSSPTAPGGGGPGGGGTFTGPEGYLDVSGSGASLFGSTFEPSDQAIQDIGDARVVQYIQDDEWLLAVSFNTANLVVAKVLAAHVTDTGDSYGWNLDNGIGNQVPGVTVHADGADWVLRFDNASLPAAPGTPAPIQLHGELRSAI